jgi:hypothetical protein
MFTPEDPVLSVDPSSPSRSSARIARNGSISKPLFAVSVANARIRLVNPETDPENRS